jgi:mono/diheme cytochrome c family protein
MKTLALLLAVPVLASHALAAPSQGEAVFQKWCAPCHAPGITHPGTHALQAKYGGTWKGVITDWHELTADYVRLMVRQGISVMPHFRKTEISDVELDALAKYVTNNR